MHRQHTFTAPTGATVHVADDFPAWEVVLTRSEDGTPIADITTVEDDDHDTSCVPYLRIYVNDGEVHEHMSPAARQWRQTHGT